MCINHRQTPTTPIFPHVHRALKSNTFCARSGLLATRRVLYSEHGYMTAGNHQELLVLMMDDGLNGNYYGHVLKTPSELNSDNTKDSWAAVIIDVAPRIDACSVDLVFKRYHYWVKVRGRYEPCEAQADGDVFALCETFDLAVDALNEMIRRFNPDLRSVSYDGYDSPKDKPDGQLDMRCFDVYGGIRSSWGAATADEPPRCPE